MSFQSSRAGQCENVTQLSIARPHRFDPGAKVVMSPIQRLPGVTFSRAGLRFQCHPFKRCPPSPFRPRAIDGMSPKLSLPGVTVLRAGQCTSATQGPSARLRVETNSTVSPINVMSRRHFSRRCNP